MAAGDEKVKRLYRSRQDRYLAGVAGGLAEYFNVDANLFRIIFIVLTFFGGIGILLYLTALVLVPENMLQELAPRKQTPRDSTFLIAIILIFVGLLLLTREFGLFHYFHFWRIPWASIWATFLILIGILLIFSSGRTTKREPEDEPTSKMFPDLNKIYRSKDNRILSGVCGGIGEYFNIDPVIVRLLWILATFASVGLGILVYVILIFVFPESDTAKK